MMQVCGFLTRNALDEGRFSRPSLELWIGKQTISKQSPTTTPIRGRWLLPRPSIVIGKHQSGR